jgi:methanesulfonate monooxygenase subunit beta
MAGLIEARAAVAELIYRAALRLDERDYDGFIDLCAPEFRYQIETYSPEIRRHMTWLDHDRAGLGGLFETLPRHHSDQAALARHVTVYTVGVDDAGTAAAISALQVFRTGLDGGASELFAVGKIHDRVRWQHGVPLLTSRRIHLDTRLLGIGSHVPF